MSKDKVPINQLDDLLTKSIKTYLNKIEVHPDEYKKVYPELVHNLLSGGPMTIVEYKKWCDILYISTTIRLEGQEDVMILYEPTLELPEYLTEKEGDGFLTAAVKRYFRETKKLPERHIISAGKVQHDNPYHYNSLLDNLKGANSMTEEAFAQWMSIVGPALLQYLDQYLRSRTTGEPVGRVPSEQLKIHIKE